MSNTSLTNDLGQRLYAKRDELSLSQREAAELLGVSERTVQNWEAGSSFPWPKHRRTVAAFLEARSVAEFLEARAA